MNTFARCFSVLVFIGSAHASKNFTAETVTEISDTGTGSPSQQYRLCLNGEVDLTLKPYLDFTSSQTECEYSSYCYTPAAQIISATCWNQALGATNPLWNCIPTFAGRGFSVMTSAVACPGFSAFNPCVLPSSCKLQYTPRALSQPVVIYSGVGGFFGFVLFWGLVYWCCRRCRARRAAPIIIRTQAPPPRPPSPPPARVAAAQNNITLNFNSPPAVQPAPVYAAPAYAAPVYAAPAYPAPVYAAPAYPPPAYAAQAYPAQAAAAPSSPPYNPNYPH